MKFRSAVLVLLVSSLSLAVAHAAVSPAADPPVTTQAVPTPQRFVVFEAFMRDI